MACIGTIYQAAGTSKNDQAALERPGLKPFAREPEEQLHTRHGIERDRDYRSRLQKFYDDFEHVDVRLFRRDMDHDWDVVSDFLQATGTRLKLRSEASHNESLSINAARLLDSANRRFPYRNENGLNPQRARTFAASTLKIRRPKFRLSQDTMDSIRDRIESECEWTSQVTGLDLLQLGTSDKGEEIDVTYDSTWNDGADVINDLSLKWERMVNTSQYYERIPALRED